MSYLRGQDRSIHQSLYAYLSTQLGVLGWTTTGPWPFNASAGVTLLEEMPEINTAVAPNTVAFTEGVVPDDKLGELGAATGGLWLSERTYFVDVLGESVGIAKALTGDIKGIFGGRFTGTSRIQYLIDYSQYPAVQTDHLLEITDITTETPMNQAAFKAHWMTVKMTVEHQFTATMD